MYLWRSAFCNNSSLRKVSRKPKILNRMWCYCCFYLHYKINICPLSEVYVLYKLLSTLLLSCDSKKIHISPHNEVYVLYKLLSTRLLFGDSNKINVSPHSEIYVLYKLQAWRKSGKCLLRASVKKRSEWLTGRKGRWKRTRKLTVLGAYWTTQPFQTKIGCIRNKITNSNKYSRTLCYLSVVFVLKNTHLKQEWLLAF